MKRLLKTIAKISLIALMSAVILRPVVVQASLDARLGEASLPKTSTLLHQDGLSLPSAIMLAKTTIFNSLRVIPKEIVDFNGLAPRFAEFSLPLPSRLQYAAASQSGGFSSLKPLVLRI